MTDETKHYYGLVDTENNGWGFVEEGDERITSDFVELTHSQWQELMEAQANGYEITGYGGKCFAAEKDKYYVDDTGAWQERTDEELETLQAQRQAEYYTATETLSNGRIVNHVTEQERNSNGEIISTKKYDTYE